MRRRAQEKKEERPLRRTDHDDSRARLDKEEELISDLHERRVQARRPI